ncbi:hypothetical protein K435DRAFT_859755 [Dendrothele bispora CBS 962.96]|uniref:Uncharacterized protein n=1 Tax=Dendrothele bispora (strain CBS 962.96) TaxID=1314807 RepID=A0A4S8LZL8_DENBC|nr:hypothetical protein K435DRAFT_859755 [Dendrothele bispora CBS 962.96]
MLALIIEKYAATFLLRHPKPRLEKITVSRGQRCKVPKIHLTYAMDVHPQTPLNTSNCTHGTPRRRKVPLLPTQPVDSIKRHLAPRIRTSESVRETLKKELSLQFDPDEWQYPLIDRILQGYDSICVAATGLGTSLMFEGVAKLAGKGKLVFSDMPVKGSRTRRVLRAQKKGFDAVAVNEDTKKTPQLFNDLKCLPLSDSLRTHAWKNDRVCRRLGAVFVDERDCAEEWGEDEFRPMYHKLSLLRPFCGYDVPFVVCTVIYLMSTFDGGFFDPCSQEPSTNFFLDALNLLPAQIYDSTRLDDGTRIL